MRRLAFGLLLLPALAVADLRYVLTPLPASGSVAVSVTNLEPRETETFQIPAWCPGFYFLQKYQDKMSDFVATAADGTRMAVERTGPREWSIANPDRKVVTFAYRVLGDDGGLGFFGVNVKADKTFVNGPAGFVYGVGLTDEPVRLEIRNPAGWDVATGMTKSTDGLWHAANYDEFIDHPIQVGKMERRSWKIGDTSFEAVFASADNVIRPNLDAQAETLRKASASAIELFGGAPFKRYVYIIHLASGGFGGGLEHRASTLISMPNLARLDLATLGAHEFIHTWNVKNIRPLPLGPFDYTQPVRTGNLWFAEGVTDYYANVVVYRAGLRDAEWLYRTMEGEIRSLQSSDDRLKVTLEEACKQTWENGGFGFGDLSYYNKGLVAGFLFDASIRGATKGSKSLDDLMRLMYQRYTLSKPGYEEDAIRQVMNEVAGSDLTPVYTQTIRSTKEVPYDELSQIGFVVHAPKTQALTAGFASVASKVTAVWPSATAAGLLVGDEVVGRRSSTATQLTLTIRRDGTERDVVLPLGVKDVTRWTLEENPFATPEQRRLLLAWLKR